ncbi:caspase domain-containing protein [Xylariaceae sp. FL1651]|nr:caspase domain-containing protein [Xylariaceae sp. FL1651]
MATLTVPKRFALLVGVDFYQNDKTRRLPNNDPVSLGHLEGAVNDVKIIQTLLQDRFQFQSICALTSTASPHDPSVPIQTEHDWPTHANIKKAFEEIRNKANSGDIFFFQFSGHGASLKATSDSPKDGRKNDLSLMTADYCCGRPAIRGWELNVWLWQLHEKGVQVIVLLDSCYSGGAWRAGSRFRSPDNWTPPPNLPSDEVAVQGVQKKPGHRDGDLGICWDLNPKGFTLMTACQSTETASERNDDTAVYGAFTLALMEYFRDPSTPLSPTYHAICNYTTRKIASWKISQNPQIFGRDRLAFLENFEPISATPVFATLKDDIVTLPVGKVHGINRGSEFITPLTSSRVIVSVDEIYDLESKAKIIEGSVEHLPQSNWFIPYRWSSENILKIIMDPNLDDSFRQKLLDGLKSRIFGDIQYVPGNQITKNKTPNVTWPWLRLACLKTIIRYFGYWIPGNTRGPEAAESTKNEDSKAMWFRLGAKEDGGVDIFGPEHILGDQQPIRGWKTEGTTDDERATELAIALAHLFRFEQILHLRNESEDSPPFKIDVNMNANENSETVIDFVFQNKGNKELSFAILILSPGFHVKQLFPTTDTLQAVAAHEKESVQFSLTIPDELKNGEANDEKRQYRDIVRTVVTTKGRHFSLKSMELPDIWNADQWDSQRTNGLGRDGNLKDHFSWWIRDVVKLHS